MPPIKIHVPKLCSQLYGIHYTKEDTDVTIHCGSHRFLCHRAVLAAKSTYFECMFRNEWRENVAGSVTFADYPLTTNTLLDVLKYFYAGNASITSSNFADLMFAADYLGILGLETADCIRILPQVQPEPTGDLLEALFSDQPIFNQTLISVLASCNLTERIKKFFNTNEFLLISVDLLVIIATKLWRSPPTINNILLDAIYRWRNYALTERKEKALQLHKLLEPALEDSLKLCKITAHPFFRGWSHRETVMPESQKPSLHVHTKDKAFRIKTFRYKNKDPLNEKFVLKYFNRPDIWIYESRFVSVDNVGLFGMTVALDGHYCDSSKFLQFASEDVFNFQSGLALAHPPMDRLFWHFDLCNLSNRGLYLMVMRNRDCIPLSVNPRYDASKQEFSVEEVQRGIYFYNIELDRWFSVPAMTHPLEECCMTVLDNMVYTIGGYSLEKIVQAYDHRERQWQHLPDTLHNHFQPQSCELDGKIYVCSSWYCERYDPVAARWEDVGSSWENSFDVQRLISYENRLWKFNFDANYMKVYTPQTATWSTIHSGLSPTKSEQVLDVVIW